MEDYDYDSYVDFFCLENQAKTNLEIILVAFYIIMIFVLLYFINLLRLKKKIIIKPDLDVGENELNL